MSAAISLDTPQNRLLAALPAEVYQRLLPHLEVVDLLVSRLFMAITNRLNTFIFRSKGSFL
jgi:hypothetical protein